MKKTAIVTDTTACVPAEKVAEYEIEVVPVPLNIDGKTYRDGVDITPEQFYKILRDAKKTPTTSASSPEPYFEAFQRASKKAESILCITEPAHFSAMYASANVAKDKAAKELPNTRIEVMECTTAAAGAGLIALTAAREATAGRTLDEIIKAVSAVMPRVRLYAFLDTLQYLAKSGRVPQAAALVNSILSIKPIFTLNNAKPHTVALPRTIKSALDKMFELVKEGVKDSHPLHVAIMHADSIENAKAFKERISANFECREIYITEFTPVMGAHTGPGLVGVTFYEEE